jgi:hypothetical protein
MSRFLDYLMPSRNNAIADWYCRQSVDCRVAFDDLLDILSKKANWSEPEFKRLQAGLGEIRWKVDDVQHRVIGCAWKNPHGYLLLIGCTHKQRVYSPPDAIETADRRHRGIVFQGKGGVCEHESPENCEDEKQAVP